MWYDEFMKKELKGRVIARGILTIPGWANAETGRYGCATGAQFTFREPGKPRNDVKFWLTASEALRAWKLAASNGTRDTKATKFENEIELVEYTTETYNGPRTRFGVRRSSAIRAVEPATKVEVDRFRGYLIDLNATGPLTSTSVRCRATIRTPSKYAGDGKVYVYYVMIPFTELPALLNVVDTGLDQVEVIDAERGSQAALRIVAAKPVETVVYTGKLNALEVNRVSGKTEVCATVTTASATQPQRTIVWDDRGIAESAVVLGDVVEVYIDNSSRPKYRVRRCCEKLHHGVIE